MGYSRELPVIWDGKGIYVNGQVLELVLVGLVSVLVGALSVRAVSVLVGLVSVLVGARKCSGWSSALRAALAMFSDSSGKP